MEGTYTLASITEEIATHLKRELDEPFKRLLADKVHAWRSQLLRRTLKENPSERIHFKQLLYVVLEKVKRVPECKVPGVPVCDVMRSVVKVPKPVRAGNILYDYVGSVDGSNPFKLAVSGMAIPLLSGKYSSGIVLYDIPDNYLEVYNAIGLPAARLDGVFDNPEEVAALSCQAVSGNCNFWDEPYPVSGDIKQAIVECILKVDFQQPVPEEKEEIKITQ